MKNIIMSIFLILLFISCKKPFQEKIDIVITEEQILSSENQKNETQKMTEETEEEKQRKAELREQLESMKIQEIIDLYINEKKLFYVNSDHHRTVSYFFISHDKVEWFYGTGGLKAYPYLYITDEENVRIERFSCYFGPLIGVLAQSISVNKEYVNITKENLIDRYIGNNPSIENYTIIQSFKINKFLYEGLEGLFFKVLLDAVVYADGSLRGERISSIQKNSEVEVIDMFYNDLIDKHPIAVRIKTKDLSGWISVNSIDFFKREEKGINGIWLHSEVRKALEEYGTRAIKGKITGDSVPLRSAPSNNSEQLFLLPIDKWDSDIPYYIEEVSTNVDVINGIEAAWYKVYKLVESDVVELGYELYGWVFGSNLSIDENIESVEF